MALAPFLFSFLNFVEGADEGAESAFFLPASKTIVITRLFASRFVAEIPRHLHERTTEMSYVLDGDFINERISYPKGTEFHIKPNTIHGPHTTKTGCSVLVTFSYPSVLDDFKLA